MPCKLVFNNILEVRPQISWQELKHQSTNLNGRLNRLGRAARAPNFFPNNDNGREIKLFFFFGGDEYSEVIKTEGFVTGENKF